MNIHVCLLLRSPGLDPALQIYLPRAELQGRISSINLMQPRRLLAFFAARALSGSCSTWCSPGPPVFFLQSCFPAYHSPACLGAWGYSSSEAGLYISLLNFTRFLSAHFSTLWRSLWTAVQPPGVSASPPNCVSSFANLLRVHAVLPSRSLMKMFHSICPSVDPWVHHQRLAPPAGLCAADHNLLSPVMQSVFSLPHCPFI